MIVFFLFIAITSRSQEIFEAVRNSDLAQVKELLEKDPKMINLKTASGMSILHEAVNTGEISIIKELIDMGMDVNDSNMYGWTAFHIASANGDIEIIELLINNGAGLDILTIDGNTPYNLASEMGQGGAAEILLSKGADNSPMKFPVYRDEYFGQPKPGKTAIPFAAGILAPRHSYYNRSITFTPDGKECYWPIIDLQDGMRRWIVGTKIENGIWTLPQIAPFSEKGFEDDVPCISPDGKILLFISNRPVDNGVNEKKENIWIVRRNGDTWSIPAPLPQVINDLGTIHQQLSLDQSNNLYFGCETDEDNGSMDIYCSKYLNGTYQKPISLGPMVNGTDHEFAPFVSPDGGYLIFTRITSSGYTLYVSFRKTDDGWTASKALHSSIKGLEGMNFGEAFVTRDGKYMIFYGDREQTCTPYWIDASFIEELRPKE